MSHPIQCQCGRVKGELLNPKATHRIKCYCKDCQAFAHFLGKGNGVLDSQGGTDIVQTQPKYISFSEGIENLGQAEFLPAESIRYLGLCPYEKRFRPHCRSTGWTCLLWRSPYPGYLCLSSPRHGIGLFPNPQRSILVESQIAP